MRFSLFVAHLSKINKHNCIPPSAVRPVLTSEWQQQLMDLSHFNAIQPCFMCHIICVPILRAAHNASFALKGYLRTPRKRHNMQKKLARHSAWIFPKIISKGHFDRICALNVFWR